MRQTGVEHSTSEGFAPGTSAFLLTTVCYNSSNESLSTSFPGSWTENQDLIHTWFPVGPLNSSGKFPGAEATVLLYTWQEKISL